MTATMSETELDAWMRASIRDILCMPPTYKMADLLRAVEDARLFRRGMVQACAECHGPSRGLCERHRPDVDQIIRYDELHSALASARTRKESFEDITRVILTDDPRSPVEARIAAAAVAPSSIDRVMEVIAGPPPAPAPPERPGRIYVIEFSNGTVKVGRTQDHDRRVAAHRSQGKKFGAVITDQWSSPEHAEWRQNESRLIDIAKDLGGTVAANEYFTGVSFADVVARAQELTFTPALVDA
jgi:hypothetical protein